VIVASGDVACGHPVGTEARGSSEAPTSSRQDTALAAAALASGMGGNSDTSVAPGVGWYLDGAAWLANGEQAGARAQVRRAILPAPIESPGAPNDDLAGVHVLCAYDDVVSQGTKFEGGAHAGGRRYKSTLCQDWCMTGGQCRRGARCDFAHGPLECCMNGSRGGIEGGGLGPLALAGPGSGRGGGGGGRRPNPRG